MEMTEIELEVSGFMEELRLSKLQQPPVLPPPRRKLPFSWASKRRRSAIDKIPSPKKVKVVVDAASSPATTLAFPPSESEEKPLKISLSKLTKKKEESQSLCDSLSSQKQLLLQEVAKVRFYRDKLREEQFLLREMLRLQKDKHRLCSSRHHHQRPSVFDRTAVERWNSGERASGLLLLPCGGREGMIDLNASVTAAPPLDPVLRSRKVAALARLNRKQKIQWKSVAPAPKFRAAQARLNRKQKIQWKSVAAASKFRAVR